MDISLGLTLTLEDSGIPAAPSFLLLANGTDFLLLADGSSKLLLS